MDRQNLSVPSGSRRNRFISIESRLSNWKSTGAAKSPSSDGPSANRLVVDWLAPQPKPTITRQETSANFHGHKRSNKTHESTTDPDARLYKKSYGKESRLSYLGHAS